MTETETEDKKEEEFGGFVSEALRGPKRGIYQNLLAGLLIRASALSDPIKKIMNLTQAAQMSENQEEIDLDLVDVASTVSLSFMSTELPGEADESVRVSWAFVKTEEAWKRYIKPWQKLKLSYYPMKTPYRRNNYPLKQRYIGYFDREAENRKLERLDEIQEEIVEKINDLPAHKQFFNKTAALSRGSFMSLQAEFSRWAFKQLLPIQAKIALQVDPQVWKEAISFMMEEKQLEESARHESSMGKRKR